MLGGIENWAWISMILADQDRVDSICVERVSTRSEGKSVFALMLEALFLCMTIRCGSAHFSIGGSSNR